MEIKKLVSMKRAEKYYSEAQKLGGVHGCQSFDVLKACDGVFYRLKRRGSIINYIVIDEGIPVLIAPLRRKTFKTMILAGDQEWFDYVDFLYFDVSENKIVLALDLLWKTLKHEGIQKITWRFLDDKSITVKLLEECNNCDVNWLGEVLNVGITLTSNQYEDFWNTLKKHSKQNIRTSYNRLTKGKHTYKFRIFENFKTDEEKEVLKKCLELYVRRQKKYGKGSLYHKWIFEYFHYLTKVLSLGKGIICAFYIDNEIAAFMQGLYSNNAIEIPRLAIDEQFSFYFPGILLINETIKWMCTTKFRYLDLCRGTEQYKYSIGGIEYITRNLEVILR